jgi:hypothetical protein
MEIAMFTMALRRAGALDVGYPAVSRSLLTHYSVKPFQVLIRHQS